LKIINSRMNYGYMEDFIIVQDRNKCL